MNRRNALKALSSVAIVPFTGKREIEPMQSGVSNVSDGWLQWGGQSRNFSVDVPRDLAGTTGLELKWNRPLGPGHSALLCDNQFGYSLHREDDTEVICRWDVEDGSVDWSHRYRIGYRPSYPEYDGPHSTPVLVDDRLVSVSIDGQVRTLARDTGKVIWRRDLQSEFGMVLPQSGYAASPLCLKGKVILPALGNQAPGAVALDLESGKELWRSGDFESSHASPIPVQVDNQALAIFHGMYDLIAVDPNSGKELWRQRLRNEAADNITFTPIWDEANQQFLISPGYCDYGTQAIGITHDNGQWTSKIKWTNRQLSIVHTNAVLAGNKLIGTNRTPTTLVAAIDVRNGRTVFRQRGFSKSNFVSRGRELFILEEKGDLVVAEIARERLEEKLRLTVLESKAWTVPTILDSTIVLRDMKSCKCYRIV